jgi:hypothetical protein
MSAKRQMRTIPGYGLFFFAAEDNAHSVGKLCLGNRFLKQINALI